MVDTPNDKLIARNLLRIRMIGGEPHCDNSHCPFYYDGSVVGRAIPPTKGNHEMKSMFRRIGHTVPGEEHTFEELEDAFNRKFVTQINFNALELQKKVEPVYVTEQVSEDELNEWS